MFRKLSSHFIREIATLGSNLEGYPRLILFLGLGVYPNPSLDPTLATGILKIEENKLCLDNSSVLRPDKVVHCSMMDTHGLLK